MNRTKIDRLVEVNSLTVRFTVLDLGKTVKDAVHKQGMLAWQYNTIGVSDAITMGGEGTSPSEDENPAS